MVRSLGSALFPVSLLGVALASNVFAVQEVRREPTAPPEPPNQTRSLQPENPPADGVPVLVTDAATGKPVEGALVTWFAREDSRECVVPEPRLTQERIQHGHTVRTDAGGSTKIGRDDLVIASAHDSYALRRWSRGAESPLQLALVLARKVEVSVVDEEGKPLQDVPISLSDHAGSPEPRAWYAKTGASGRASFEPIDFFVSYIANGDSELHVRPDIPIREHPERQLDARSLPDSPVGFRLPASGRVSIDVVDSTGKPLSKECRITVYGVPLGDAARLDTERPPYEAREWTDRVSGGHHEVPYVELGQRLLVEVWTGAGESPKARIDGPKTTGEIVSARVVVEDRSLPVRATVVDSKGHPLANATLAIHLVARDANSKQEREADPATSDASGLVTWTLAPDFGTKIQPKDRIREATSVEVEQISEADGIVARGHAPIPALASDGPVDLGTIHLEDDPVLVTGVVVDDAGTPIEHAGITVEAAEREKETDDTKDGAIVLRRGRAFPVQTIHGRTARGGVFEIHGAAAPNADYSAKAEAPDEKEGGMEYVSDFLNDQSTPFHPGDRGIKVALWRAGTIAGSVLADPTELGALSFDVSWKRADGVEHGYQGGNVTSHFTLPGIPHGVATVEIHRVGGGTDGGVVAKIEGIDVKPGEIARLAPIELSTAPHLLDLTIRDEAGNPIPRGWLTMPDPEEEKRFAEIEKMFAGHGQHSGFPRTPSVSEFTNGAIILRSQSAFRAVAIGAPGFASKVLHDAEGPVIVILRPAPSVALMLDFEGDAPPPGFELMATVATLADDKDWFRFGPGDMSSSRFGRRNEPVSLVRGKPTALHVGATGKVEIKVMLGQRHPGGYSGRELVAEPDVIDIADSLESQEFHIRVRADELQAAVKAFQSDGDGQGK